VALTDLQIATLVERYHRERDRFDKMATVVGRRLSAQLRAAAIPHVPTFRPKEEESLRGKLARDRDTHEYALFEREFAPSLLDLAGARIMLYRPADEDPTCEVIERLFIVPDGQRFRRDFRGENGYRARHRVVRLPDELLASDASFRNLTGVLCEVQVVTFADHIINELQHDILYKRPMGQPSPEQQSLLDVLRDQLSGVRTSVERLTEATERHRASNLATIESPDDLSDALRSRTGRRLRGDFEQLLKLLAGTFADLTRAELDKLPLDATILDGTADDRLSIAGIEDRDGVARVVSALWPSYGADFLDVASSWRGRPGPVSRLLQALAHADQQA
jgi:ppGpp synthetase/RelA/SpoT-type nucleotidyltranferase